MTVRIIFQKLAHPLEPAFSEEEDGNSQLGLFLISPAASQIRSTIACPFFLVPAARVWASAVAQKVAPRASSGAASAAILTDGAAFSDAV
jgi:hypothetical protein